MEKTILFIDDEKSAHHVMELSLLGTKYKMISAHYGKEALDILVTQYENIDCIFLDMMLPDMQGEEIFKIIRDEPRYDHIVIILQSGLGDEVQELCAQNNRITAALPKPYAEDDIMLILERYLGNTNSNITR